MPDDKAYGSPTSPDSGSGFSRKIGPLPMWVWVVGVGGVVLFIYYRRKQSGTTSGLFGGGSTSPTSTDGSGAVGFDPNTGLPVDANGNPIFGVGNGSNGGSGSSATTLNDWVQHALSVGKSLGMDPLAVQKAIFDYTHGNPLNTRESAIMEKILGKIGYPPDLLDVFGTIPSPKRKATAPPGKKPPGKKTPPATHTANGFPPSFGNPIFWKWLQGVGGNKAAPVTGTRPGGLPVRAPKPGGLPVFAPKLPVKEPVTHLLPTGHTVAPPIVRRFGPVLKPPTRTPARTAK